MFFSTLPRPLLATKQSSDRSAAAFASASLTVSLSLVEMPLLPPLLPSTPAPTLFCRLRFSPPSAVLLLLPPIHQLNPLHVIQA